MAGLGLITKRRLVYLLAIFAGLSVLLIIRIGWIQLAKGDWYQQKAAMQQNQNRVISPKRGIIYDRNHNELAVSASVETISANPQTLKKTGKDISSIALKLSEILGMDTEVLEKKLTAKSRYEIIKKKISKDIGDQVRKYIMEQNLSGIYVDEDTKRYYPNRNLAAHVIGFTGSDNQGLDGIEAMMEQYLKGTPGRILNEVDASGNEVPMGQEKHLAPENGLNVVLTIDETIQAIAEKELETALVENKVINGGEVIIMNPNNGDILALTSKPDFDLNNPWAAPPGEDPKTWDPTKPESVQKLFKTVWRDKAVADTYEPGSTFKAITTCAGIEEGVVTPETQVNDFPVTVGGWPIKCWRYYRPHGNETFAQGVYNSCNPVFVRVAQGLGINKFYKYVKGFGFNDKTGIILPGEAKGITHSKPTEVDMATAAFGQSFTVTPMQLITAYAAIANGGTLMKPRLVQELTDDKGSVVKSFDPVSVRRVITPQTSETVRRILEGVVSEGTGENAYIKGYRVAGKTGTAETVESRKGQRRYIASFSSFAPSDNPQICVLVILDYPTGPFGHQGGVIAAPVAGRIVEKVLDYLETEKRYTEKDKQMLQEDVYVPDITNKTVQEAKTVLSQFGLDYKIEGSGENVVVQQTPKADAVIPKKSVVVLYTSGSGNEINVTMPNILNKTISEATNELTKLGLNIRVTGQGVAIKQSIKAGTQVKQGSVIDVEFRLTETE